MQKYMQSIMFLLMLCLPVVPVCATEVVENGIKFVPIEHATLAIITDTVTIYVDPVGSLEPFRALPPPDIILITHIHYDHLNVDDVKALKSKATHIIGPQSVIDQLGFGEVLNNGETGTYDGVPIQAIPAYNMTKDRLQFHPRSRGDNGYVLTLNGKRIYLSGDTEDTPEMRSLKNIDYAFVCMNLPYTMTVKQAASAVLAFKPKVVFPYHYRGKNGMSDLGKFKKLVSKNPAIEVRLLNWYPSGAAVAAEAKKVKEK